MLVRMIQQVKLLDWPLKDAWARIDLSFVTTHITRYLIAIAPLLPSVLLPLASCFDILIQLRVLLMWCTFE